MCGGYATRRLTWREIIEFSRLIGIVPPEEELEPRFNIRPWQYAPIVATDGERSFCTSALWGLVPHWFKDPMEKKRFTSFNARSEAVRDKPVYRGALQRHRCLVPAVNFYEWRKERGKKQPYAIGLGTEERFFMAGIWSHWSGTWKDKDFDGDTFTILTTDANPLVALVHKRMPLILHPEDHERWMYGDVEEALKITAPLPSQLMCAYPVGQNVNFTLTDGADRDDLVEPVGPPLTVSA